jgi:hypothetical protein
MLFGFQVVVGAAVVHAESVIVLEDGDVTTGVSFPWFVEDYGDVFGCGVVEFQAGVFHGVDEEVVDEGFESGADVEGRRGLVGGGGEAEKQNCGYSDGGEFD